MEFKAVKALDSVEPKSKQEIEADLLKKHEEAANKDEQEKATITDPTVVQPVELKDDDVLSFIKKKYNRELSSVDELFVEKSTPEALPPDVDAFLKYHKETGRGVEDFSKLAKDYSTVQPDDLLREYYMATEEDLEPEDIQSMMQEFAYDEDVDDESTINKAKLAKKKAISKAKKFFNQQKETYKKPLESRQASVPDEDLEDFKTFKEVLKSAKTQKEADDAKRDWFNKKTDEVFGGEFKGFEFAIGEKKLTFTPAEASELKKSQSTPLNFISKFLDEKGMISDAVGYHRSLAIAMHPERFAKFFYEQGVADATEDVMRKTKNINMGERRAPEIANTGGTQVRVLNPDSGHGLRIKSRNK
jgi:hypothetical protein